MQFLQQGIASIFKFVQMIWTWSLGEISTLMNVPWQSWPLWKQLLLVFVRTLPSVIVAGIVAVVGVWILNNSDFSKLQLPSFLQSSLDSGPARH